MPTQALPPDEEGRLLALAAHRILDTEAERSFDEVVKLASEICAVPVAMMSLVDRDRQWNKSVVGVELREIPRTLSFCSQAILQDELLVVPDATLDRRFSENPLVASAPFVRFYAGAQLTTADGHKLGALCVIDTVPHALTEFQRRALGTLRRQLETQLRLRLELFEHERIERQKEELTALVVHDLKSPLAALLANAQFVLGQGGVEGEAAEATRDIVAEARRMNGMILNLLDLSLGEGGALETRLEEVEIQALLAEVARGAGQRVRERGQLLSVAGAPLPLSARADPDLLRRVLGNLVDNALKYAPDGGTIELSARAVGEGDFELRVTDRGPGVPEAERRRIFEKFARLGRDAKDRSGASRGLGLAFCRLAAEAHGGTIWVEAAVPKGSAFCLRLPIRGP